MLDYGQSRCQLETGGTQVTVARALPGQPNEALFNCNSTITNPSYSMLRQWIPTASGLRSVRTTSGLECWETALIPIPFCSSGRGCEIQVWM